MFKSHPIVMLEKLGFHSILESISNNCYTAFGRGKILTASPSSDREAISDRYVLLTEIKDKLLNENSSPEGKVDNLEPLFGKARIEANYLSEEQFFKILSALLYWKQIRNFFNVKREETPRAWEEFENFYDLTDLIKEITSVIDQHGNIKSNASRKLQDLSSDLIKVGSQARTKLNRIYKKLKDKGWTPETEITIRSGRLVVPVLAEYKRQLKGFIHGESSTGQTVFIEPAEVLSLNNESKELQNEREREIIRILVELTSRLSQDLVHLRAQYDLMAKIDMYQAIAVWAKYREASFPIISKELEVQLIEARHPILEAHLKELNKDVVAQTLELTKEGRIVVISGPNAGGKSVLLKTIGLMQVLVQAGLPITADKSSRFGIFKKILIDIGDEQSIDNDLSTYSSHLQNMKTFLEGCDENSLFLIDEFGTGTDPRFGGPIAVSILEQLNNNGSFGVVNTHYGDLKTFASKTIGIANAAMEFDAVDMKPLYQVSLGSPGSSYALEIAERIGLDPEVLRKAKELIGDKQIDVEEMLLSIEKEKKVIDEKSKLVQMKDQLLKDLIARNTEENEKLKSKKTEILDKARRQASALLERSNQLIEKALSDAGKLSEPSKSAKQKGEVRNSREEIDRLKTTITKKVEESEGPREQFTFSEGQKVRLRDGSGEIGQIISIKKDKARVEMGGLRMEIKLELLKPAEKTKSSRKAQSAYSKIVKEATNQFQSQMDMRGKSREEALTLLDKQMEWALVLGYKRFTILHGTGGGVLRLALRERLREYDQLKKISSAHPDAGGEGITHVDLV